MEAHLISAQNQTKGKKKLPAQFEEAVRPDIIKRSVFAIQNNNRQPYGAKPRAGQRAVGKLSRRRRDYKGSYGHGISRVPRKILSHRGTRFTWVGAVAPGTVGGRRAHPPKPTKDWSQKVNKKENRKAIRSALSATVSKEWVTQRGHKTPSAYPIILESECEQIKTTKELMKLIESLGLSQELSTKRTRVGKGKTRGRRYKSTRGLLIVVSKECMLERAAGKLVETARINTINAEELAPGAIPGRLTLYTEAAINRLEKEKLFEK